MRNWGRRNFNSGSSSRSDNREDRLLEQQSGEGSSPFDKPGGFLRAEVGRAERKREKFIREEVPRQIASIDKIIKSASEIENKELSLDRGSNDILSVDMLIHQVNRVRRKFRDNKDVYGVSEEKYKEMRKESRTAEETYKTCIGDFTSPRAPRSLTMASDTMGSMREVARSSRLFLEKVHTSISRVLPTADGTQPQSEVVHDGGHEGYEESPDYGRPLSEVARDGGYGEDEDYHVSLGPEQTHF